MVVYRSHYIGVHRKEGEGKGVQNAYAEIHFPMLHTLLKTAEMVECYHVICVDVKSVIMHRKINNYT